MLVVCPLAHLVRPECSTRLGRLGRLVVLGLGRKGGTLERGPLKGGPGEGPNILFCFLLSSGCFRLF